MESPPELIIAFCKICQANRPAKFEKTIDGYHHYRCGQVIDDEHHTIAIATNKTNLKRLQKAALDGVAYTGATAFGLEQGKKLKDKLKKSKNPGKGDGDTGENIDNLSVDAESTAENSGGIFGKFLDIIDDFL